MDLPSLNQAKSPRPQSEAEARPPPKEKPRSTSTRPEVTIERDLSDPLNVQLKVTIKNADPMEQLAIFRWCNGQTTTFHRTYKVKQTVRPVTSNPEQVKSSQPVVKTKPVRVKYYCSESLPKPSPRPLVLHCSRLSKLNQDQSVLAGEPLSLRAA